MAKNKILSAMTMCSTKLPHYCWHTDSHTHIQGCFTKCPQSSEGNRRRSVNETKPVGLMREIELLGSALPVLSDTVTLINLLRGSQLINSLNLVCSTRQAMIISQGTQFSFECLWQIHTALVRQGPLYHTTERSHPHWNRNKSKTKHCLAVITNQNTEMLHNINRQTGFEEKTGKRTLNV